MSNRFYFAYGSNMNPDRIRERIPHARFVGKATIYGWKLVERLYADIERAKGHRVEGVLYLVNDSEILRLDAYEGYPRIYASVGVIAHVGLVGRLQAFTYTMTDATKAERQGKAYPQDYRLICSAGAQAHGVKDSFKRKGDPVRGISLTSGLWWGDN